MKIIDITQELFACSVYPGDTSPAFKRTSEIKNGDVINLTEFSLCAHNGTHIDAPCHFIDGAAAVDGINLSVFYGECTVADFGGIDIIEANNIKSVLTCSKPRLLLKGSAVLSADAAREIVKSEIMLVGVESQSVGPVNAPKEVHMLLLEKGIIPLEGLKLADVETGDYILSAFPLNLKDSDGSPCRAVLIAYG